MSNRSASFQLCPFCRFPGVLCYRSEKLIPFCRCTRAQVVRILGSGLVRVYGGES